VPGKLAPIGAHVSVAGGLSRCLTRGADVGAEVVQVFVANPRAWASPPDDPDGDALFGSSCADGGIPVFVHAPYLINFGSPSPETLARSVTALSFSLRRAAAIGASGVVMHAGSAVLGNDRDVAMAQVRDRLLRVLDAVGGPRLLIEPTAGGGGALAADAASLADYLDVIGRDERVGVCLDTCHMHAAGHDLSTPQLLSRALKEFARAAGKGGIGLVHANDSRDPVGSKRDRHACLGSGTIGREAFAALFQVPALRGVPLVVETADTDHASDIATLKALRAAAAARR
jgi:deoxyribonuclease-4